MVICGCMSLAAAQVPGFGSCPTEVQAQSSLDIARVGSVNLHFVSFIRRLVSWLIGSSVN